MRPKIVPGVADSRWQPQFVWKMAVAGEYGSMNFRTILFVFFFFLFFIAPTTVETKTIVLDECTAFARGERSDEEITERADSSGVSCGKYGNGSL